MNKFAYDLPKDLYKGLRVRPSMDMIANMIEKDPYKLKYPDRSATFYLNSPQFLSILQDTNVGLAEQSKRLEKHKIAEAMARMNDEGGVGDSLFNTSYETASSGGGDIEMISSPELRRRNLEARVRKAREENEKVARQEAERKEQEKRDYEYAQFLKRQEEEARRIQVQLAQATAAASSAHPVAVAGSSLVPGISQEQLQAMVKGFVAAYNNPPPTPPINITYLTPQQRQAQQGIVPRVSPFGSTPFRLSEDVMTDSVPAALPVKRTSEDVALPSAKAKVTPTLENLGKGIGMPEGLPKQAKSTVRKSETKQGKNQELEDQLSEVLLEYYSRDAIRSAFTRRFPENTKIPKASGELDYVSKATKSDISKEWIKRVSKRGTAALTSEIEGIKDERKRLSKAAAPKAASFPPVGVGGAS